MTLNLLSFLFVIFLAIVCIHTSVGNEIATERSFHAKKFDPFNWFGGKAAENVINPEKERFARIYGILMCITTSQNLADCKRDLEEVNPFFDPIPKTNSTGTPAALDAAAMPIENTSTT